MSDLIPPGAAPEKIAGGFRSTAGPVFSRRGHLLFSDPAAGKILKWEHGSLSVYRENSDAPRGLTFDHQGRLLACEGGRVTRIEKDGRVTVLAGKLQEPYDLVYAIDGSIYFTDASAGALYQITRAGQARVVSRDCRRPVGVALSPTQQQLYVADAAGDRAIRVYKIGADGTLLEGRVFTRSGAAGIKSDEAGNVWAAGERQLVVFDAAGKQVASLAFPQVTNYCNWGEGFRGLYVTAENSVYKLATKVNGTRTY